MSTLERAHKAAASAAGELALALARRRVRRSDLDRWAQRLEAAARMLRDAERVKP